MKLIETPEEWIIRKVKMGYFKPYWLVCIFISIPPINIIGVIILVADYFSQRIVQDNQQLWRRKQNGYYNKFKRN